MQAGHMTEHKMTESTQQDEETKEKPKPLWLFVHPEDYAIPALQIQKATANAWRVFKKNLRDEPAHETLFKPENELQALSEVRLSHFFRRSLGMRLPLR